MDIEPPGRPLLGKQLNSETSASSQMGATHAEFRLCKNQMAPIWKFLCERVTTIEKAKALRSRMEEKCVSDSVTGHPLMTRRGTHYRTSPEETTNGNQRLQYLELQSAALEKQVRNAKTVLGGLEERVQTSILKAGRLGML